MIPVAVHIYDDLLTLKGGRVRSVPVREGSTLEELVRLASCLDGPAGGWVSPTVVYNGEVVPPERRGEVLVAGPIAEVRIAPAAPTGVDTVILIGIALASAAASALLATQVAAPPPSGTNDAESRRFGFSRISSDAIAGDPIPVVLGRLPRYGGKVISRVPGEGFDGDSRLKILICLGHGPIAQIGNQAADFDAVGSAALTGIFLQDGQPIASFPGCRAWGRMGTANQAVIPGFKDAESLHEVGVGGTVLRNTSGVERSDPLSDASGEAVIYRTTGAVNAVVPRVRFAKGLYSLSPAGQINPRRAAYRARWRGVDGHGGTSGWSDWQVVDFARAEQSELFSAWRMDHLIDDLGATLLVALDVQVERVTPEPTDATAVDEMTFDSAVEVVYGNHNYGGMALLALELVAGEQITSVPAVSADVKGYAALRIWDGVSPPTAPVFTTGWSDNPLDHLLEVLTNKAWGMGADYGDANVDFSSLFQARTYAEQAVDLPDSVGGTRPRFRCNLVMDQHRSGVDWLRAIGATARVTPAPVGNVWRCIQDRPQPVPVEVFTDGSIAADGQGDKVVPRLSYTRTVTKGGRGRPNRWTAQFGNELFDGRTDVVSFPRLPGTLGPGDAGELWLGADWPSGAEDVNEKAIKIEGVTNPYQVMDELIFAAKKARGLSRTIKHTTTKPFVAVQPGDRYDVASSMLAWGRASGRVLGGSTTSAVRLDRTITVEPGAPALAIEVVQLDNTIEVKEVAAAPGIYAPGMAVAVSPGLATAPAEGAEYSVGQPGIAVKPFTCTSVRCTDDAQLMWEVEGLEYAADVYDHTPGEVDLPEYGDFSGIFTPPGPLLELKALERVVASGVDGTRLRHVELAWRQAPADAALTAGFFIFRREAGTQTWVRVPQAAVSRRAAVLELVDLDTAFQFVVVPVSVGGASLSPYDPRNPIANVLYGLMEPPPPPPTGLTLTNTGDNTYTLSWDPVTDAVAYQVLAGGTPGTGLPNDGAEDCLVVGRSVGPAMTGLRLAPNDEITFWVRSVGRSGRLSFTAEAITLEVPVPGGRSLKMGHGFDLSSEGTLTNLAWDSGSSRLRLVDPASPGVWLSPEVDPGSVTATVLTLSVITSNDAADPVIDTDPFALPSIAADQWGVVSGTGPTAVVGMLMPPWPDDEQAWLFEVRVHDGVLWSDWLACPVGASIIRTFNKWQVRVTLSRQHAPYAPALSGLSADLIH